MKKIVVAVTGTVASGKSTACNFIQQKYPVIYADNIGHMLLNKKKELIVSRLGNSILDKFEKIDKNKLSELIFSCPLELQKLNDTMHPFILEEIQKQIEISSEKIVFVEIPPVFQKDISIAFDFILNIETNLSKKTQRLAKKKMSFLKREFSQNTFLQDKSDLLIKNNSNLINLRKQIDNFLLIVPKIQKRAKIKLNNIYGELNFCISITEKNLSLIKKAVNSTKKFNSLIELRLDYVENLSDELLIDLINLAREKIIMTFRTKNQGGQKSISKQDYQNIIKTSVENDCRWIDLEFSSSVKINFSLKNTKIILSHHNFRNTPQNLDKIITKMRKKPHNILKFVTFANDINDNFRVFRLLQKHENIVSFCMGEKGEISRVLCLKYGSVFTYSFLEGHIASAPGQIEASFLKNIYRIDKINKKTKIYGLIGKNIINSNSKFIHNDYFAKSRINACFLNFKIDNSKELKEFIENFRNFGFFGAAVTIPYKEKIMPFLDSLDETAQKIGAVNTIKVVSGRLVGFNTDYLGAIKAMEEQTKLSNKKILVLGSGGATRAIIYGLSLKNCFVSIAGRNTRKVKKLAQEFDCKPIKMEQAKIYSYKYDILINCTSVGMNEDKTLLENFVKNQVVMDIVYSPLETKLIRLAKKIGCKTITGDRMLDLQAVEQQKIWNKTRPLQN